MAMGGIGEAALLGAVMGGGSAMLTGGDPLKGALMGTLTGGIGGAVSPALSALTGTTATVAPIVAAETAAAAAPAAILPEVAAPAVAPGITSLASGLPVSTAQSILGTIAPGNVVAPSAVMPATAPVASVAPSVVPPIDFANASRNILGGGSTALTGGAIPTATPPVDDSFLGGIKKFADNPLSSLMNNKFSAAGSALAGASAKKKKEEEEKYAGPLSRFKYNPDAYRPAGYADGGIASLGGYDQMVGEQPMYRSNMASGGIANLGSYSDGGRMLKGPGDGMSDNIPATIAGKRPARLADGEFVVPADVVSHLGNGSTDAGAKQLYAMMNKVRKARTGRKAQGREINPRQYVPA